MTTGSRLAVLTIVALATFPPSMNAAIVYVDQSATGPTHDGTSWCSAFKDLQLGLATASAGDEIRVANGLYKPDFATGARTATFRLRSQVVMKGGYAGCGAANPDQRSTSSFPSVLSGDLAGNDGPDFANYADNSYHVVTYDDPAATGVVFDGFTVRAGNSDGTGPGPTNQGGGIHIRQGDAKCLPGGPTIRNSIVEKNRGQHHGAVNDHGLSTVIEDCIIRDNYSDLEGGGLQVHSGAPTIRNTTFLNNVSGGEGGGAWAGTDEDPTCSGPSTPEFENCVFDGNVAPKGGGLFIKGSGPALRGCTFRRNRAVFSDDPLSGFAAGIYNLEGVGVTVTDCLFTENDTDLYGGGMYNEASDPIIRGCRFIRNELDPQSITLAGAMLNVFGSNPWIEDCVFEGNTAFYTSAVLNDTDCNPVMINCLFKDNYAPSGPGAVFNVNNSHLLMINSVFLNNTGQFGGAMHNAASGSATIINTVFAGNTALDSGGAVSALGADVGPLINCTLYGNTANNDGGGVFVGAGRTAHLYNTIVWNSSDSSGQAETSQVSGAAEIHHSCVDGWSGNLGGAGNTGANPGFVDADGADNTIGTDDDNLRLGPTSPLRNSGDDLALPADTTDLDLDGDVAEPTPLDLDRRPRIVDASVDMGAFEYADCNGNGIPDDVDIASGFSSDCDGDGSPDECEDDCNDNDIADDCEPDSDGDGVTDACDGCPADAGKTAPGACGCGLSDTDADADGTPDCIDLCPGFDDGLDDDGDGVPDDCDECAAGDDRLDCNHNAYADPCEVLDGTADDLDGNGVPDECDMMPAALAEGCRSLTVTPAPGDEPVALRLTSPDMPCLDQFIDAAGGLSGTPLYRTPAEWGTIVVVHQTIVPDSRYSVRADFAGGTVSAEQWLSSAPWGDVIGGPGNTLPDGNVNFMDIGAVVNCYKRHPTAPAMHRCDLMPAWPDGLIGFQDIGAAVQGYKRLPYPNAAPCP